jgi:hypothetical protein
MTSSPRGLAVIINIQDFNVDSAHPMLPEKLSKRLGSEKDAEELERLFQNLDFTIEMFPKEKNGNHRVIMGGNNLLKELYRISKYDFEAYDCFVLCIMSHGTCDSIYASDGNKLTYSLIIDLFKKSKSLFGKPKMFFIQSCRGEKKDPGVIVCDVSEKVTETDPPLVGQHLSHGQ